MIGQGGYAGADSNDRVGTSRGGLRGSNDQGRLGELRLDPQAGLWLKAGVNYVAHALIAADLKHFMLGQLLGDFAINSILVGSHPDLQRGVRAHRALDAWTDRHPAFIAGSRLLQGGCSRYAPVVMDVVIDHVLVRHWSTFHPSQSFSSYLCTLYGVLRDSAPALPERMRLPAQRMQTMQWFSGFEAPDSMQRILGFMAKRVRRPNLIESASQTIECRWESLERLSLELLSARALNDFSASGFS